jgi:hypothetical protein
VTEQPPRAPGDGADDSRAEQVLSQALRVMAGGGKVPPAGATPGQVTRRRLSTGQLILLAAIVGLLIGIGAGFVSLML